jgi:type IV pilus assembly protein PilB
MTAAMTAAFIKPLTVEDRLLQMGAISESQLELARREQRRRGDTMRKVLVDLGFATPEIISRVVASEAHIGVVELSTVAIDREAVRLVPTEICRRHHALPYARKDGTLIVAMADPFDIVAIDTLRRITGCELDVVSAPERDILNLLDQLESSGERIEDSIERIVEKRESEEKVVTAASVAAAAQISASAEDSPIINLVSQIITRAATCGASDIHFEPEEKVMRIRVRVDGVLRPDVLIPKTLQSAVIARMKILADMDVAENRIPQDGRASVTVKRRPINLRVSTLPTSYGESVVCRILDAGGHVLSLASIGLAPDVEKQLRKVIDSPYGVVIVTGPTGSGKTTTLYSVLNELSTTELSIFTLEDPVELRRQGMRQTQIKDDVGLTFSAGLRALLRQDPDVILVGETRDTETATLMVRAALTGHLVFTTLHTNDAPSAIPRLLDMGVEPFLLPGSLLGVLAQRLVRRLCDRCRKPVTDVDAELAHYEVKLPADLPRQLWRPTGCPACSGSGYKGRHGIFELMLLDDSFHAPIIKRAGANTFVELARARGMKSMFEDGLRLATSGLSTVEEVLRVARAD